MSAPRAAGVAHAAALASVHAAAFAAGERWDEAAFAVQLGLPGAFGFLDARGGMVLARVAADEAEILTLGVAPWVRRLGIARALVAAALGEAARRGAAAIYLEVGADNLAARELYRVCGFSAVGRRVRYYADGQDALVLRAAISCESREK